MKLFINHRQLLHYENDLFYTQKNNISKNNVCKQNVSPRADLHPKLSDQLIQG
jgi:hypothetical protein